MAGGDTFHFETVRGLSRGSKERNVFSLIVDNWDDYRYKTTFMLTRGTGEESIEVGLIKIGYRGMPEGRVEKLLPSRFGELGVEYFSLGQDRDFYEAMYALPNGLGNRVLIALRDVVHTSGLLSEVEHEEVFTISLRRSVSLRTITNQFSRILEGKPALTPFYFQYSRPLSEISGGSLELDFNVEPGSNPPSNVHVLIGSNGVGKSWLLRDIKAAHSTPADAIGTLSNSGAGLTSANQSGFASIVHVSFSAFDSEIVEDQPSPGTSNATISNLSSAEIEEKFARSVGECLEISRARRWWKVVNLLGDADPLLADYLQHDKAVKPEDLCERLVHDFKKLSSGHKIVLLIVATLVEMVEETSLVLLDEPETHLHPPLLSALIRAVSELLVDRNGVALIATHSPVVLQEVPKSCVWVLSRTGEHLGAYRPKAETFGESVSFLTAQTFHLDINRTGYVTILRELLRANNFDATSVLDELAWSLGSEGQLVLANLEMMGE